MLAVVSVGSKGRRANGGECGGRMWRNGPGYLPSQSFLFRAVALSLLEIPGAAGARRPCFYCVVCGNPFLIQQYTKTASVVDLCIRGREPSEAPCGLTLPRISAVRSRVVLTSNFPAPYTAWFPLPGSSLSRRTSGPRSYASDYGLQPLWITYAAGVWITDQPRTLREP
ncbi:hypothetical protein BDM02DRAFT_1916289 [Thelephora ganbajun]|uniref:Uncharacterized protein n=1 Tax=Thelephora ganbajun TaxID=370292 RepID=A0ACB6ZVF8_THEGA|nr:hypothetical protein BDM02DRAFT_1916289 [Thelephora ganbajun]